MPRVTIKIYDEDTGEELACEDSALFDNEEEIANQAFRVQKTYHNKLDLDSQEWDDF
jgi:hypothetical protein